MTLKMLYSVWRDKNVKPENIKKLNFPLTLSEEYGVPFQIAFGVVWIFLFRLMMDDGATFRFCGESICSNN